MKTYPIPVSEMRERYLKLYSGAVNDILRFEYKMHAALPSEFAPLDRHMKLAGQAFTIKGAPDITTDGEFEMRAQMLEDLHENSIVVWDCTGDRVTAQWGEVMTMAAIRSGCCGALVNGIRDTDAILAQDFPIFNIYRSNVGMLGRFRMPPWAPDGSGRLLLSGANLATRTGEVLVIAPDGGIEARFGRHPIETDFFHTGFWQSWSPDAKSVYFLSGTLKAPAITRRDLATGRETTIDGAMTPSFF